MRSYKLSLFQILIYGTILRIVVYLFQSPFNVDKHYQVVEYIFRNSVIPLSTQLDQAYHPPLYYWLASWFLYIGDEKVVQLLSLFISILTLVFLYILVSRSDLSSESKRWIYALAAFLPQFVMFQNYISNDTLAICIGALLFLQIHNYIEQDTRRNEVFLGVVLGLGLLTKGSFLSFIPPLLIMLIMVGWSQRKTPKSILVSCAVVVTAFVIVGCYKYVQNGLYVGNMFINNLDKDASWIVRQQKFYEGFYSFIRFNFMDLIEYPTISRHSKGSYSMLLYATFWYQHFVESNFIGFKTFPAIKYLGSTIYIAALIPTSLIILGMARIVKNGFVAVVGKNQNIVIDRKLIFQLTCLLILFSNVSMLYAAGIKYQVFSIFQARLFFPSMFGVLVCMGIGMDWVRNVSAYSIVKGCLIFLFSLFFLYFAIEISVLAF